jgi:hypothetical protein
MVALRHRTLGPSSPKGLNSFMIWTKRNELLQITEIGRDGRYLLLGQVVRDRLHDRR